MANIANIFIQVIENLSVKSSLNAEKKPMNTGAIARRSAVTCGGS